MRVYRARQHATPARCSFEIDAAGAAASCSNAFEEERLELGAIYHSHVHSDPYPSQTDINFAANWPGVEWVIVGLASRASREVRSYLIEGGEVREVGARGAG